MVKTLYTLFACTLLSLGSLTNAVAETFDADASLVRIEVTKQSYDYRTPWTIRSTQTRKNGIVISANQILTTADGLSGQYLCRVRKGDSSKQYTATLSWIDYYANLAIFDVEDSTFWQGIQPVSLADTIPQEGDLQVYRWRSGRIESRAAEIIRLYVGTGKTSYVRHLQLSASCEIDSAGWAEVVIDQGKLIGLTSSASSDKLTILPAPFIQATLDRQKQNPIPGAGYFDFYWMSAKNPALVRSKGFEHEGIGIVITDVGARRLANNTLHVGDILYEIDGFEIDNEGNYIDPQYGRLSMRGLSTRAHVAGEQISMKVWRNGETVELSYTLPQADFSKSMIPERRYDAPPNYLIAGGLLFQPLNGPLLSALGKNKPVLLDYYNNTPQEDREGVVILSSVLPDAYNRGYESLRLLVLDEINGQAIHSLQDVQAALKTPIDGFHKLRFAYDSGIQRIVLDAESLKPATARILEHYRIPKAQSL